MGLGSLGDREGRAVVRTLSELLVGNGAAEDGRRFRKKEACCREDSRRAILFSGYFFSRLFQVIFPPSFRIVLW